MSIKSRVNTVSSVLCGVRIYRPVSWVIFGLLYWSNRIFQIWWGVWKGYRIGKVSTVSTSRSWHNGNEVILICTDSIPPESQWFDVLIISTEISHVGLTVPLISCIMVTFESISHKPSIAPQALAAGQMIWNWFASWKSRSFVYMGGNLQEPRLISHETMVKPFLSPYNKSIGFRIDP